MTIPTTKQTFETLKRGDALVFIDPKGDLGGETKILLGGPSGPPKPALENMTNPGIASEDAKFGRVFGTIGNARISVNEAMKMAEQMTPEQRHIHKQLFGVPAKLKVKPDAKVRHTK